MNVDMDVDILIIALFLISTLAIGLYASKGVTTFKDYAVGNRQISTTVISFSLIATIYGGRVLSAMMDAHYHQGFYAFILDLTSVVNVYLASRFVIVRMQEFVGHLSIAESMGRIYGSVTRVISAILGIIMSIAAITVQIKIGFSVTTLFFPELAHLSIYSPILLTIIFIVYASFGGARSVALTDVYQFCLFGVCFPMLIYTLFYYTNGPTSWTKISNCLPLNVNQVFVWNDILLKILPCFLWRSIFPFDPARMQRFYMVTSVQQAVKVFNRTAIARIVFPILFLSIAAALHICNHTIPKNQDVLHYILGLSYFPGMRA